MLLNKITKNQKPIQSLSHPSGCPNIGVHRLEPSTPPLSGGQNRLPRILWRPADALSPTKAGSGIWLDP